MAYRVLLCMHLGFADPRELENSGSEKVFSGLNELFKNWGEEGIRLIASFGKESLSLDGFTHHAIFEIDSVDTVWKMDLTFSTANWNHEVRSFELNLVKGRDYIDKHFAQKT